MTGNPICKKIPLGARVRHRTKRYEGWIDGSTPDEKQCRVYIHSSGEKMLSAPDDLEVCNDIADVMDVSTLDRSLSVTIGREEFRPVPIFCQIWTLGSYHARPLLKTSSRMYLPLTERINSLKSEIEVDGATWGGGEDSDVDDVEYFYNLLNPLLETGFPIAIVPTHDPASPNWGLVKIVRRLSVQGRIDATSCLVRIRYTDPQRQFTGTERKRIEVMLKSVEF